MSFTVTTSRIVTTSPGEFTLSLPAGAVILNVLNLSAEPFVVIEIPGLLADKEFRYRRFLIVEGGALVEPILCIRHKYIGSFAADDRLRHLYELVPY